MMLVICCSLEFTADLPDWSLQRYFWLGIVAKPMADPGKKGNQVRAANLLKVNQQMKIIII